MGRKVSRSWILLYRCLVSRSMPPKDVIWMQNVVSFRTLGHMRVLCTHHENVNLPVCRQFLRKHQNRMIMGFLRKTSRGAQLIRMRQPHYASRKLGAIMSWCWRGASPSISLGVPSGRWSGWHDCFEFPVQYLTRTLMPQLVVHFFPTLPKKKRELHQDKPPRHSSAAQNEGSFSLRPSFGP